MKLRALELALSSSQPFPARPDHLRGFIGSTYRSQTVLHQHEDSSTLYRYPRVRYLILNGEARIIGYNEGAEALQSIYPSLELLILDQQPYPIYEKRIHPTQEEFNASGARRGYRFVTPWLALSQDNYPAYRDASGGDRKLLLERILVGNILSAAKGFAYHVDDDITVAIHSIRPTACMLKGVPVIGFYGSFEANFTLPPLFGLGKSVSRGYGAVTSAEEPSCSSS